VRRKFLPLPFLKGGMRLDSLPRPQDLTTHRASAIAKRIHWFLHEETITENGLGTDFNLSPQGPLHRGSL
jgi:hypothetical protein